MQFVIDQDTGGQFHRRLGDDDHRRRKLIPPRAGERY